MICACSAEERLAEDGTSTTANFDAQSGSAARDAASDSLDSSEDRQEDAVSIVIRSATGTMSADIPTSADNATAASLLCASLSADSETLEMYLNFASGLPSPKWMFPDCLFDLGSSATLKSISVLSLIIQGNSTYPDPFLRLSTAMNASFATKIQLSSCIFLKEDGSPHTAMNWSGFFSTFPSLGYLYVPASGLTGSLPSVLPSSMTYLGLQYNAFTGSIPSGLFSSLTSSSFPEYNFLLFGNQLTGGVPSFASLPARNILKIDLGDNLLDGTVPGNLLPSGGWETTQNAQVILRNNRLTGTIPPDLWGLGLSLPLATQLYFDFANNRLAGSLSSTWMTGYSFPSLGYFSLDASNNSISGGVPASIVSPFMPNVTNFQFLLYDNLLDGTIDSNLTSAFLSKTYTSNYVGFGFFLGGCKLKGTLKLSAPVTALTTLFTVTIDVSDNALTSFVAEPGCGTYLYDLDLSGNYDLTGTLDKIFVPTNLRLYNLAARNTRLTGTLPDPATVDVTYIANLMLDNTTINFCAPANRAPWPTSWQNSEGSCTLRTSTAFYCDSLYQYCPTSKPQVIDCSASTRPTIGTFQCIAGAWTAVGDVTNSTITIPAGAGDIVILGNLTSESVKFAGRGSKLSIDGCAPNLKDVTVEFTSDEVKHMNAESSQLLVDIIGPSTACTDLSTVSVKSNVKGSTCKRVKTTPSVSGDRQLSALFTVSSTSGCNTWWIILVSVVCGVILIAVVVFIIVISTSKKARRFFRPYESSNGHPSI